MLVGVLWNLGSLVSTFHQKIFCLGVTRDSNKEAEGRTTVCPDQPRTRQALYPFHQSHSSSESSVTSSWGLMDCLWSSLNAGLVALWIFADAMILHLENPKVSFLGAGAIAQWDAWGSVSQPRWQSGAARFECPFASVLSFTNLGGPWLGQ